MLLKIIGAECTVINRKMHALKVHEGVEMELRSIGIWNDDVLMLPRSQCMHVCRKYYSDLTMHARRFVVKAWSKCSNSRRRYGLK